MLTTSGSYLAARHASVERDAASAATFYRSALRSDPKNNELLDRAFISSLADGDIDEAVKLADRILAADKTNRVARLVIGVRDLKLKKYASAQTNINQSVRGPITDLVATLLSSWAAYGAGDVKAAVANIDKLAGPEWYPIFKDLHSGMILELAGKEKDAGVRLERAYKLEDSMLRVSDDYARWLSRNKDAASAKAIYEAFDKKLPRHPLVQEAMRRARSWQEAAADRGFAAGRRSRGALRHRLDVDPPRRRGSGARVLAACALSGAEPSPGVAVARRSL